MNRDTLYKELKANMARAQFEAPWRTKVHYQGRGHEGFTPIGGKKWMTNSSCFSTVCNDNNDILVKWSGTDAPLSEKHFKNLVRMMKSVSTGMKRTLIDNPPDNELKTCRFVSPSGYATYFAFILWRFFYRMPRYFLLLEYFFKLGYTVSESYYLSMFFVYALGYIRTDFPILGKGFNNGVIQRLSRVGRYKKHDSYSMRRVIGLINRYWNAYQYVSVENLTINKKNLSKTNLDRLIKLQEIEEK